MKMILFNQNPMITKLLESVSKKLELPMENFNHYQELSARLKKDPEWLLIADDECLEKLDQVDWLELKEIISQNKNSVCMYKKGNEAQPFLEGFETKIKKPFLPTEMLKVLQKKLGSNTSELEPSQNLDPTQEVLETNWDELENLGDLEALAKEEPNNEEQLLPTLNTQEEKQEIKETPQEEKEEIKEMPQEEKPKDDETQEGETLKDKEVSKELEMQEEVKEETQEERVKEQEPIKEEMQEIKEEKQEETQDSPSAQELEAMQELVKEIQENSNGQENKKETQESAEIPQDKEIQEVVTEKTQVQELEIPKEKTQESTEALQETQAHELEKQEIAETPQEKEKQEIAETPQEETQEKETPKDESMQESAQNLQDKETPQEETQEDHYESIEDIPEPVMAKAMGEELPFLNESVAKTPNNENDTETLKESDIKTPQEKEESDKTSSPLELRLNLQDLLKSLNQESLKSLLENKTLSIKITLEDKKPNA
ncbi:chemotaxis regulatory protein ChePep [Helicobacter pylori]|uniref:chemotaxis regulatory protein ChePep n=1 Tax=Helicobacter pylori TaxID=210 RepID=UPI0029298357|nr:chemotaxis regulatory protein ChePep [Helicobacter pylori]MDU9761365.1 chemotaxis regulatory protein ChePep [Helicobacter pylori]